MINVLSLFDGISCGRVALERGGHSVGEYYASEIDKYAITVSRKNWPDIIQLGDITKWREWDIDWKSIGLVLAGSPCQGFSFAGKGLNFQDPRSKLFFVFVDILHHIQALNPNVKFLLENVRMKAEHELVITKTLDTLPVYINSALVSAQNRPRVYWTNIPGDDMFGAISQPEDKGILLKDIILQNPDNDDFFTEKGYLGLEKILSRADNTGSGYRSGISFPPHENKASCVDANYHKGCDGKRTMVATALKEKSNTILATMWKENAKPMLDRGKLGLLVNNGLFLRKLNVIECERLQTLVDNYTAGISNSRRYHALGNGWTVDVIVHILKGLKNCNWR